MGRPAEFSARLRHLLEAKGFDPSPSGLARLLARHGYVALTPQTVSGWLSGKFVPRHANLRALAAILDVDPALLRDGQTDASTTGTFSLAPRTDTWTGEDRLALAEFEALSAEHRRLVRELIHALARIPQR